MKKLFTLFLAMAGFVGTASADFYVSGDEGITNLSSGSWGTHDENKMTLVEGSTTLYQLVVTGKSLTRNSTYNYKITDGTNWYGWGAYNDNAYFKTHTTGTYSITYIFDSSNNNVYEATALLTDCNGIYMHGGNTWVNSDDYKFSYNGDGFFTLDVDVSSFSSPFYYRFHIVEDDNDFGAYADNVALNDGIYTGYEINLTGNFWKNYNNDGKDHNFCLPLDTKPCAKLHLALKIENEKVTMNMQCSEKVTTNSKGFATFVNNYPLTISGATAFYATDNGNGTASATAITNPATNIPMLIKGENETSYYFAVAASGTDDPTANAFKAGTGAAVDSEASGFNYILNGDTFYKAAGQTVAVGKAYLQLSKEANTANARILIFPDDDETQGISAASTVKSGDAAYYNLSGQRVNAPSKGLFIRDGKKVIIK